MSRIVDHNIYLKTDQLYEPLRNTLRKSTISSSFLSPQHHLTENRLSTSRVAKNMRSLSPAETELIVLLPNLEAKHLYPHKQGTSPYP